MTPYSSRGSEPTHYIAMEYVAGVTLRSAIHHGSIDLPHLIQVLAQVADGLVKAHGAGIIHRDLKPENIMITEDGYAKILDFGLAKLVEPKKPLPEIESMETLSVPSQHTRFGIVMGTIGYMSPEQVQGKHCDPRSDVFSFGCMLYEAATRKRPFIGDSLIDTLYKIAYAPASPIREFNPEAPAELDKIVARCIAKNPDERYQSIRELAAELRRFQTVIPRPLITAPDAPSSGAGRPDLPGTAISEPPPLHGFTTPVGGTYMTLALQQAMRRRILGGVAGLVVFMAFSVSMYVATRPTYYPAVMIGDVRSTTAALEPELVTFFLERALSQEPEITVMRKTVFDTLVSLEKKRAGSDTRLWGLFQKFRDWSNGGSPTPALVVSVEPVAQPGGASLQVTLIHLGNKETLPLLVGGASALLSQGMDTIIQSMLAHKKSIVSQMTRDSHLYRPISSLLTPSWEAMSHFWRGEQAWNVRDLSTAQREFQVAIEIDGTFALAHFRLGRVLAIQNRWDDAKREALSAQQNDRSLTEIDRWGIKAFLAGVSSKPTEDRDALQVLRRLQPNQKEHLYQLAESYFNTGDVDDAISYYKSTLEIDDRFAEAYNHIGYAYSWKGDHDSAIQALNRYLEIYASANAFDSLGDAYMYAGSYDKAAKMKEQAFQKNLDMYYVKRGQALIEICQGKLDSAESRLHAFVGSALIKNEAARYQAALAYLYYRRGEWEKAFASCSLGVELLGTVGALPDSPAEELYWLHGMIELQRGHIPAAKGSLQMLTDVLNRNKISASNYKPWYKFARHLELRILTAERNIPAALQAAQDLDFIKGKLGYWGTIYERAFIFDEIGQSLAALALHAEAKKAFQDAIAYNPHYALAHYHYARLLLDQGAKTDAGEQFGAFLSEWKEADRNLPEVGLALKMAKELGIQPR